MTDIFLNSFDLPLISSSMGVKIKEWSQAQRNLVIDLFKQGKTFRSINKATGMALGTISDLIKKYNMFGYVQNQPRFGAKRKTTSRIDRQIVKMVQKNRFLSAPKVSSLLEKDFGLKVSSCTIRNRLKESGFKARVPRKKPFLSKIHRKRRLVFAKKYVNMPVSFWRKVLWTDESKFNLVKSDGAQKVWRKKGEAFTLSCIRGTVKFSGGNVMVWGSMAWNGTGKLEFIDGIMDSEVYVNILNKNLLASTKKLRLGKHFIFQQDNDPKHVSKKAKEFFIQKQIELLEWPAQSPDINPIEHLWAILDKKCGTQCLKRKEDLKIMLQEA